MNVEGKRVVVLGVADESSIAWAIARAFHTHGATVSIGYQQKFFSRVRVLLRDHPGIQGQRCDITADAEMAAFFERFRETPIDVLVHAIAFAAPPLFTRPPSEAEAGTFNESLHISAWSLASVVRHAKPCLREWASVITLTSEASTRAMPMYGLMGVAKSALESLVRYLAIELGDRKVRVNAILAGPIETPAAMGVVMAFLADLDRLQSMRNSVAHDAHQAARRALGENAHDDLAFASAAWKHIQQAVARKSAIQETISAHDVADCALFLGSDYSRKITGQVMKVDCGLSTSLVL
jgi:enoyl-[acyl-carrier protein] reductase I